jgi:hypothetical protein
VVSAVLAPEKTFLGWVNEVNNGRHDGVGYRGGEDSVVGVGNAYGPSISDEAGGFFWEEEKKRVVKVGWWCNTRAEEVKSSQKGLTGQVGNRSPGSEGNAIRTWGGVFSARQAV